jgi:hypothetical protein
MLGAKTMTIVLALIAIFAVLGLVVVGLSTPFPSSQQQSQSREQPSSHYQSPNPEKSGDQNGKANGWTKIKKVIEQNEKVLSAVSTVVIAAFTIVLAFATGFLYFSSEKVADAAKDSADVAKDTLIATHRPWLRADIKNYRILNREGPGFWVVLDLDIKNIGNAPAKRIRIHRELLTSTPDLYKYQPEVCEKYRSDDFVKGFFLFPGDGRSESVQGSIPPEARDEGAFSTSMLVCIAYDLPVGSRTAITSFVVSLRHKDGNFDLKVVRDYPADELEIERQFPFEMAD